MDVTYIGKGRSGGERCGMSGGCGVYSAVCRRAAFAGWDARRDMGMQGKERGKGVKKKGVGGRGGEGRRKRGREWAHVIQPRVRVRDLPVLKTILLRLRTCCRVNTDHRY